MTKFFTIALMIAALFAASKAYSYEINGQHARKIDCRYGTWKGAYGYVGVYEQYGKYYQVFFGNEYCEY